MQQIQMKIRVLLCVGFVIFSASPLFPNDQVIYLKDGKVLTGEIINQTAVKLTVRLPDGTIREISKLEVRRVAFREAGKLPETKDKTATPPITPVLTPEQIAQQQQEDLKKQEEESKKLAAKNEKAEQRKKEIEESRRHKLEIFLGSGAGNLNYQSPYFYEQAVATAQEIGGNNGQFTAPTPPQISSGKASAAEIRYSLNRFVAEVGGSTITSNAKQTSVGTNNINAVTVPDVESGSYQNSMKHVFGNVSYSVYPKPKYDIRPVVGMHQFWFKGDDNSRFTFSPGSSTGTEQYYGLIPKPVSDSLKGYSIGLQFDMKLPGNFELRTGIQSMHLRGDGTYKQSTYLFAPILDQFSTDSFGIYNKWNVTGTTINLKLLYNWKYGVNFWIGINSMDLKYKINNANLYFEGGGNNAAPTDLIAIKALFDSFLGPTYAKDTKSTTVLIGASYSLDFNK
ncbi:hypothetical protein EHO59_05195 [Leptospira semungkisensis]|uniref:Uncharacterized protein n=1 Tax=Leptospira semungkisensis TaxID=2484985 RepID=A0A4V3JCV0_9LEPT|nr:hypothetical protein [Leptospira semungkisensis]TGK07499.1 hypothetical protein EHO59_05195 [Leptospira semungkisensis]